jgi:hypothetical protein
MTVGLEKCPISSNNLSGNVATFDSVQTGILSKKCDAVETALRRQMRRKPTLPDPFAIFPNAPQSRFR